MKASGVWRKAKQRKLCYYLIAACLRSALATIDLVHLPAPVKVSYPSILSFIELDDEILNRYIDRYFSLNFLLIPFFSDLFSVFSRIFISLFSLLSAKFPDAFEPSLESNFQSPIFLQTYVEKLAIPLSEILKMENQSRLLPFPTLPNFRGGSLRPGAEPFTPTFSFKVNCFCGDMAVS